MSQVEKCGHTWSAGSGQIPHKCNLPKRHLGKHECMECGARK